MVSLVNAHWAINIIGYIIRIQKIVNFISAECYVLFTNESSNDKTVTF